MVNNYIDFVESMDISDICTSFSIEEIIEASDHLKCEVRELIDKRKKEGKNITHLKK